MVMAGVISGSQFRTHLHLQPTFSRKTAGVQAKPGAMKLKTPRGFKVSKVGTSSRTLGQWQSLGIKARKGKEISRPQPQGKHKGACRTKRSCILDDQKLLCSKKL